MKTILTCFFASLISAAAAQHIDTLSFEAPDTVISINTNQNNNLWQKAQPSKLVFDSAYVGSHALITDSVNPYPDSNLSSFTLNFLIYGGQPSIGFWHRWDTDTSGDGGFVEMSMDNGLTWEAVYDTSAVGPGIMSSYGIRTENMPLKTDTLFNGKPGFSGESNGWEFSRIYFQCFAIKAAIPVQFRFSFISDTTGSNGDGWMLDHFVVDNRGDCSDLPEIAGVPVLEAYPTPAITSSVNIDLGTYQAQLSAKVYALSGALVREIDLPAGKTAVIPTQHLPAGQYQVLLISGSTSIGQARLIKP